MVKMGVIDPAKVTRVALQNAASIAGRMLVAENEKDEKKSGAAYRAKPDLWTNPRNEVTYASQH
jgi:chaperonin GroEL (HSP60 family)